MGESLWRLFLEDRVTDLQEVLLCSGVHGLMDEFETWLTANGYLKAAGEWPGRAPVIGTYRPTKRYSPATEFSFEKWVHRVMVEEEYDQITRTGGGEETVCYDIYDPAKSALIPVKDSTPERPWVVDAGGEMRFEWEAIMLPF